MSIVTNLAGATALGWTVTDTNGTAATETTSADVWRAEKKFTLAGATTAAFATYDIETPSAAANYSPKIVHELATTQARLWSQIDAWETRMRALGDKVPGWAEKSYTPDVH